MKKLCLVLLAAFLITPAFVKADPVNENSTVTNTPAANARGAAAPDAQKKSMAAKKHSKKAHHKKTTPPKTDAAQ